MPLFFLVSAMTLSTHKVEVISVALEPHPNADTLSLVRFGGYTCVTKTDEWRGVALAAYIPPDSVVPDTPEYAFLKGNRCIKARRFRGVWSQGLLMPAPPGASLGDDVAAEMGVTHYEPPVFDRRLSWDMEPPVKRHHPWHRRLAWWAYRKLHKNARIKACRAGSPPPGEYPKYDVDAWRRYRHVFEIGELVCVHEKIHGANARYVWRDGRLWVGSRTEWKRDNRRRFTGVWKWLLPSSPNSPSADMWWAAIEKYPYAIDWLRRNEGMTLYGEVYGWVQDLRYGARSCNDVWLAFFDVYDERGQRFLSYADARSMTVGLPWAPLLYVGGYDPDHVERLAEGPSVIDGADHIREGVVVRPVHERWHLDTGRVILKIVSNAYLERA